VPSEYVLEYRPGRLTFEMFQAFYISCFPQEPFSRDTFREFTESDHYCVFDGEALVGIGSVLVSDLEAHIKRVAVIETHRRSGIGRQLMRTLSSHAGNLGATRFTLSVQADNAAAVTLYRQEGFTVVGNSVQFLATIDSNPACPVHARLVTDPIGQTLDLDRNQFLLDRHRPPTNLAVFFVRNEEIVGYAVFGPEFPGAMHFTLRDEAESAKDFVDALLPFSVAGKRSIRVTTGHQATISRMRTEGFPEAYSLYAMERTN
jgi:GNAT superfamily N-acetyltransferase